MFEKSDTIPFQQTVDSLLTKQRALCDAAGLHVGRDIATTACTKAVHDALNERDDALNTPFAVGALAVPASSAAAPK